MCEHTSAKMGARKLNGAGFQCIAGSLIMFGSLQHARLPQIPQIPHVFRLAYYAGSHAVHVQMPEHLTPPPVLNRLRKASPEH